MGKQEKVKPGMNSEAPPELWRLNDDAFEELTCSVLDTLPDIKKADRYGVRGETDYGVDIKADRKDGTIEVGQSKCYQSFGPQKIIDAVDVFLSHWDTHWAEKNVKTFHLLVACSLSQIKRQNAIETCRKKLAKKGVEFEHWSDRNITQYLKGQPEIVSRFFEPPEHFLKKICGAELKGFQPDSISKDIFVDTVNKYASKDFDAVVKLFREGKFRTSLSEIDSIKFDTVRWEVMERETRAKILRIEATIKLLQYQDIKQAEVLASQADELFTPEGVSQLRTLIKWTKEGAEEAYNSIKESSDGNITTLKATLLSALDKHEEARKLLSNYDCDGEKRAEKHRILAGCYLYEKNLKDAITEINKAEKMFLHDKVILQTKGALLYYKALSPSGVPKHIMSWPEPVDWSLIKKNKSSIDALREAHDIFERLIAQCELGEEDAGAFETWKLACLCNDMEKRKEAESYCIELLTSNPCHSTALAWGVSRNLLDKELCQKSKRSLNNLIKEGKANVASVLGLCSILIRLEEVDQAAKVLKSSKAIFESEGQKDLWKYWIVQTSDEGVSDEEIESADPIYKDRIYFNKAVRRGISSNDFTDLERFASEILNGSKPKDLLSDAVQQLFYGKQFDFVSNNANEIVSEVGTEFITELVLQALYEKNQYSTILGILEAYKSVFGEGELPLNVRRIKLAAQQSLGHLPQAIKDARELAEETKDANDVIGLAEIYVTQGNIPKFISTLKKLRPFTNLNSGQLLRYSFLLSNEDRDFSIELLKAADEKGIERERVAAAYHLCLTLGISSEMSGLSRRFYTDAEKGLLPGVELKSFDEIIEMVESAPARQQKKVDFYNLCQAPIHLVSERENISLAVLYHSSLNVAEEIGNPATIKPLFIRHGGRQVFEKYPASPTEWNICMDITSLLLCQHLGILDHIEATFSPISIPFETSKFLHHMKNDISQGQPDRIEAVTQIIKEIDKGRITVTGEKEFADKISKIDKLGARYLTWTNNENDDSKVSLEHRINCSFVARDLEQKGRISQATLNDAINRLGGEGVFNTGKGNLQVGENIYCDDGLLAEIAISGLLSSFVDTYNIIVTNFFIEDCKQTLLGHKNRQELSSWIGELRSNISEKIENGIYSVLPANDSMEDQELIATESFQTLILHSLLKIPNEKRYMIWSDDRMINGYNNAGTNPTICVLDVLDALVEYGRINKNRKRDLVSQLRRANARFIPLSPSDLQIYLTDARSNNGAIVETPELALLRRYYSGCFQDKSGLLSPTQKEQVPNQNGDVQFVLQYHLMITKTISSIWADSHKNIDRKKAESNWIIENLYIENYSIYPQWIKTKSDKDKYWLVRHASYFINAMSIDSKRKVNKGATLQEEYLDWCYKAIISKRLRKNSGLFKKFISTLLEYLTMESLGNIKEETKEELDEEVAIELYKKMMRGFVRACPADIRDELVSFKEVRRKFGFEEEVTLLPVYNHYFETVLLAHNLAEAAKGSPREVSTYDDKEKFLVNFLGEENSRYPVFIFENVKDGKTFRLASIENLLFLEKEKERIERLVKDKLILDISERELRVKLQSITTCEEPSERIESLHNLLRNSAVKFYENLNNEICETREISSVEIISGINMLPQYLRIDPFKEDQKDLSLSVEEIIAEYGLLEAIKRYSNLPCYLPDPILSKLANLSKKDRNQVINDFGNSTLSFTVLMHYVHLAIQFGYKKTAKKALLRLEAYLTSKSIGQLNATFFAILRWISHDIEKSVHTHQWSKLTKQKISWLHANKVISMLMEIGDPGKDIEEFFRFKERELGLSENLVEKRTFTDISDAKHINEVNYVFQSIGYALNNIDPKDLTKKLRSAIREHLTIEHDGNQTINFYIYADQEIAPNIMNAYFDQEASEVLGRLGNIDELNADRIKDVRVRTQKDIIEGSYQDNLVNVWMNLFFFYPHHKLPENMLVAFENFVKNTNFYELLKLEYASFCVSISYATKVCILYGFEEGLSHIKVQIQNIVQGISNDGRQLVGDAAPHLINILYEIAFSRSEYNLLDTEKESLLSGIWSLAPEIKSATASSMKSVCDELLFETAEKVWPYLILARSY